jgi:hypothetical protein
MPYSYIRNGLTRIGVSSMLCRFRASVLHILLSVCSRLQLCLPAHWAKRLVDTNVRALTGSDLAWADVALVSGMLVQKDNLVVILAWFLRFRSRRPQKCL